jgi:hypothetical protein
VPAGYIRGLRPAFIIKTPAEDVVCESLADARRAIVSYVQRTADVTSIHELAVVDTARGCTTTAVDVLAPAVDR